jgi:uncharacterized protein
LRRSVAHGGLPLSPVWQRPRQEPPRLFVLVDVSRSMEAHAAFFLRVARAFVQCAQARAFVFHVHLAEVTPLLQRDSATVQEKINAVTAGFGAGTRIAANLQAFARQHARAQLGRDTRVWLMSDGFDTDAPEDLQPPCKPCAATAHASPGSTPPASPRPPRRCSVRVVVWSGSCRWPRLPIWRVPAP